MLDLHLLSLLSKYHQGWHHRWRYFTHKRRNQKICSWTEREALQRDQNSGRDGLCELGVFLKWRSSAHQRTGEEGVFSDRRFCHPLISHHCWFRWPVNFTWKRCEHSHALPSDPREEAWHRKKAQKVALDQPRLSLDLCPSEDGYSFLTSATWNSPGLQGYFKDSIRLQVQSLQHILAQKSLQHILAQEPLVPFHLPLVVLACGRHHTATPCLFRALVKGKCIRSPLWELRRWYSVISISWVILFPLGIR